MKALFLIGRMVFGGFFLYNGINHLKNVKSMAPYVASKKVPMPEVAVAATGVALLIGGASILAGVKPKVGTLAIIGFLGGVSPIMHDFWRQEDPNQRMNDMINFTKNMAMLGAALALMGVEEPWPASVPVGQPDTFSKARKMTTETARKLRKRVAA